MSAHMDNLLSTGIHEQVETTLGRNSPRSQSGMSWHPPFNSIVSSTGIREQVNETNPVHKWPHLHGGTLWHHQTLHTIATKLGTYDPADTPAESGQPPDNDNDSIWSTLSVQSARGNLMATPLQRNVR